MRNIYIFFFITLNIYANTPLDIVNKQIQDLEQKRVFEEQKANKAKKNEKLFDKNIIKIDQDLDEKSCINIKNIYIRGVTVFEDGYFDKIIEPYLNRCNGIRNLSNLRDKITNKYIDSGFITSKAYIKAQDLNNNSFVIDVFEGKIEEILSKDVNSSNLYLNYKNRVLNIKDLEVALMQGDRLNSQNLDLQLYAGNEPFYTKIYIENNSQKNSYYGTIGVNNFGTDYTGKYQIYNNLNYENLLNINDILSFNLNTTNNALKTKNKTIGSSINYSVPIERALFNLFYNYSNYKQINSDFFGNDFLSNGDNYSFGVEMEYKLFHNINNNLSFIINYEDKSTRNYLNNAKLDLQSYKIRPIGFGYKHSYVSNSFDFYSKLLYHKGISGLKEEFSEQNIYFDKFTLDFGFNKYFDKLHNLQYNLLFRGQYSNNNLFGTEEISVGGIYSVRGFNNISLSGNKGFYLRNEILQRYYISQVVIMPYVGFDYGYIDDNIYSNAGSISGTAFGSRFYYKDVSFEIFYNRPKKETEYTKEQSSDFYGFSIVYSF
ncbi:ShlB/FhaC/HecB family hemolysin secretion/activation protein [Aliarcobacter skirrowii]|uniref:Hemolysin secretion/activation protein, ShlB/FhaC/HecB family n=1 Tax=Aliarcobacter skirrowii CCUG 10374 TaxID=1032239 RepID=A0AAD0SM46_9BACT|nr:ShlB/FhaC/HecB family hemolysin secretion/activation protein [Aliarcobacter skirrowii]AXX85324.1 hemolysin secretion/activation protein, ShlB/FhaC/HecB family [Aliarcobacter skirrowii CCUG 10374]KAB0620143.1 ShlB/FhaC/HecB family hemolysin secretion/activation protein [Aliarcobacter skirrowii CCUG 10374]RXI25210.1 ShlB/FhaC/HecB family hemolysin secretion/activation protein [Aliarcobacter skirrowii CCUG 10374]SUU96142.1 Hemolysin transporter protein shlB precursor [Aliarcobacter skirrowii]